MVNVAFNTASLIGILLILGGIALWSLPIFRPRSFRFQDIPLGFFALLYGVLLILQGWRLDPVLQAGQMLLIIVTIFYAVECILRR